jgi:class 3 adenylate cyclase
MQILSILCIGIALLCLLPYVSKYLLRGGLAPYVQEGLRIEEHLRYGLKSLVPTMVAGFDLARFYILVLALFMTGVFSDINQRYRYKATYDRLQNEFEELHRKRTAAGIINHNGNGKFAELEQKMEQIKTASKKDRGQLLKEYYSIKNELESFGRDLTFLSIDVVDSTAMKVNEEPEAVETDFSRYREFVESKLLKNGCVKFSWTGDGLMSCFNTVEAGIQAGKDIISEMALVNYDRKIKHDFNVRCGINTGHVYYDESKPLDQLADRVIDIAGHMQKYAEINSICVAKNVVEPVQDVQGFTSANRIVDGYEAYVWHK